MARVMLIGLLFFTSLANAQIISDRTGYIFFCRNKKKTIEVAKIKNTYPQVVHLNFAFDWDDGFAGQVNGCMIKTKNSCPIDLQPGQQTEIKFTVPHLNGGEQYGGFTVSSIDPSNGTIKDELNMNLGASSYGGCWEP